MTYALLKSIIASHKVPSPPQHISHSFFLTDERVHPYTEPTFTKISFPAEKPSLLLVSANGASGKTTTAHALAHDLHLPVLDLAKHKAVGDNTLTGVLTNAYSIDRIGAVLEALRKGTHAVIVDAIDEGRAKTNDLAFEAFLDDLVERSRDAPAPAIVVFGRGQVLLDTWCHFEDHGATVGMVQIDPFSIQQAKSYIDRYLVDDILPGQRSTYQEARDRLLTRLGLALTPAQPTDTADDDLFLSFIGYPPVLDAIVALLRTERNYHRVQQALGDETDGSLETSLLIRISRYLLEREYMEKARPLFVEPIARDVGNALAQNLRKTLYAPEEQCARVLSRALGRPFPKQIVDDDTLNARYEKAVANWFSDHPFLDDTRLRNVVFAAFATSLCALSDVPEYRELAHDYSTERPPTYHLLYIMHELAGDRIVPARFFNALLQSSCDFRGIDANLRVDIDGNHWEEADEQDRAADLSIFVEFPERQQERAFLFRGSIDTDTISLGPSLVNTHVTLPCKVNLSGARTLDVIGCCGISAETVRLDTPDLIVRDIGRVVDRKQQRGNAAELYIDAHVAEGHAEAVTVRAGSIAIQCETNALSYSLARYVVSTSARRATLQGSLFGEKYRRLRRILSDFASHGKGGLAKFRAKIEHNRVLRGELGHRILQKLLSTGVLSKDIRFYYVNQDRFSQYLGISWQQLREYQSSLELESFLQDL